MDHDALQELARQRAQVDLRALKKLIRDHYRLYSCSPEQLESVHELFQLSLEQFVASSDQKATVLARISRDEVETYRLETESIERQSLETRSAIEQLKQKLEEARAERDRRIAYDAVTKTIEKLPSRSQGSEQLVKLQADIARLVAEKQTYADTRRTRQEHFDRIVDQLVHMREAIQEEKNEQARRRALEEEGDDDEDELVRKARRDADEEASDEALHNKKLDPRAAEFRPSHPPEDDVEMSGPPSRASEVAEEGEEREEGQA